MHINNFTTYKLTQYYQYFPLSIFVTKPLDITETHMYNKVNVKKYCYFTH
jgi:hypothetical protein